MADAGGEDNELRSDCEELGVIEGTLATDVPDKGRSFETNGC